jgi:RNA polymerase sigma-70 factor, ECF subfamily
MTATKPPTTLGRVPVAMPSDLAGLDGPPDFDETFREHYGPMVRSLAGACGDREAAADAVQDAFTRAFVRWRRISRYDQPTGWIRHVALNRLRDHFRKEERGRRARDRLQSAAVTEVAPPEPADGDVSAALARPAAATAHRGLLFYLERLSVREIAASMKLSEGAVKYHLHAGRSAVREWLERG